MRPVIFLRLCRFRGAGWDELSKRGGKRNSKRDGRQGSKRGGKRNSKRDGRQGSKRDGRRGSKRDAYIQNYQHIAEKKQKGWNLRQGVLHTNQYVCFYAMIIWRAYVFGVQNVLEK